MKMDDSLPPAAFRLRLARRAAGFRSAKAAADRMGININTYYPHETGRVAYASSAEHYAKTFHVTVGWLLNGEGPGPRALIDPNAPDHVALSLDEMLQIYFQLPAEAQAEVRRQTVDLGTR